MMASKMMKALVLGVGMTFLTSVSAFAYTGEAQSIEGFAAETTARPDDSVTSQILVISDEMMKRQQEIDLYVFKEHAEELAAAGFKVTHTGVMENYVEIGITPYSPEAVDYLTKALGGSDIKIVEGMEAIPVKMEIPTSDDGKVYKTTTEVDETLMYTTGVVDDSVIYETTAEVPEENVVLRNNEPKENERDVTIYTATGAETAKDALTTNASMLPIAGVAAGILLLGGSVLAIRRRKSATGA